MVLSNACLEFQDRDSGEGDGLVTGLVAWGGRQGGAHMNNSGTRSWQWDGGSGICDMAMALEVA